MSHSSTPQHNSDHLTSYFLSGNAIRSRSVSDVVLMGNLNVPLPSVRLIADWEREILRLGLEPGDVEPMPLVRTQARWPDYVKCVQAASDWVQTLGLPALSSTSNVALMACRGAKYHHDAAHYGGSAFCNLFLSEDLGLDLHFPAIGLRIPLTRGLAVIFDTGQPHAVIQRGRSGFHAADFESAHDCNQVFLSWELPIENTYLARSLGVVFDIAPATALMTDEEHVLLNGSSVFVCSNSGLWCLVDTSAG